MGEAQAAACGGGGRCRWARLARVLGPIGLGLAVGLGLRLFVVQSPELAWACAGADDPWWCLPREGLILGFRWQGLGLIAAIAGGLALLRRGATAAASRRAADVALIAGGAGLLLYAPELSAAGVLLGALCWLRP